jgi:amidase
MKGLRFGWLGDLDGHLATEPGRARDLRGGGTGLRGARRHGGTGGLDGSFEPVFQAWKTLRHWQAGAALAPVHTAHPGR